eukprot:scaffold36321_cov63-Attheya_sp.AAC.2
MRAGLRNTPNMFPAAALKIAAASSPPDLFVKTKTILTISGKQAQITIPSAKLCSSAPTDSINRETP